MAKPKLLATHALFPEARAILGGCFDADYARPGENVSRPELLARIHDKEALVCLLADRVDAGLLEAAPRLRIVATVSVGYDNLDLDACTRRTVAATNTPGVLDDTTADFAWALLMAVARRLVEGDHVVRSGEWPGWDLAQMLGADVHGKTLGIIGFGRIGRRVARRALGFEMRVLYSNPNRAPAEIERQLRAEFVSLPDLLRQSDFVTLHVPLRPETRHLISRDALARMKSSSFLINTSRGPVVDEAALVEALVSHRIAGAALDVFEHEPRLHPSLPRLPNVVLAPHIGSASVETRTKMAVLAAQNAVALFEGRRPPNILNPAALESK